MYINNLSEGHYTIVIQIRYNFHHKNDKKKTGILGVQYPFQQRVSR